MPKRFAAYPIGMAATSIARVVVVSRSPVSTEERPRSCRIEGSSGNERRIGDAVDEGEGEEDAELEVEAIHALSIVTADRFVKCE